MAEVKNDVVFPSNTMVPTEGRNPEPDEAPLAESLVDGERRTKKRGLFRRIGENVFSGDRATVKDYVIFDVLLPAFKDTVSDMITNSIDILFNGSPSYRRNRASRFNSGVRTDYSSASMSRVRSMAQKRASEASQSYRRSYELDFEDILLYKHEADDILAEMRIRAAECPYVQLAEYYSLCGRSYDFTMRKCGWDEDDLIGVHPKRAGRDENGVELYYLPLPRLKHFSD